MPTITTLGSAVAKPSWRMPPRRTPSPSLPSTLAPELGDAESVYRALGQGVRAYAGNHKFQGVGMGQSGGRESAPRAGTTS